MNCFKVALGMVCYYSGLDILFYWLNSKAKRVVTYHNVLPDDIGAKAPSLPVAITESRFRRQVHELTRFLKADANLAADGTLTITFDDGYLNQYEVAPRVLASEGVSAAIIFIAGDVLAAKGRDTALGADRALHNEDSDFAHTGFLDTEVGKEYERLRLTGMNLAQIEELRQRGWKIGYHTKSHRCLSDMDLAEKRVELKPPEWLKDNILSYPFGRAWEVDYEAVDIAKAFGYECAYSNQFEDDGRACRHFLPRMVILDDKYWLHFELSGAKYFFKNFKLLPRSFA